MKFQLTLVSAAIAAALSASPAAASDRELDVAMDVVDSVDTAQTFEIPLGGDHVGDVSADHHDEGGVATGHDPVDVVTGGEHHDGGDVAIGEGDVPGIDEHDVDEHDNDDADTAETSQVSDIREGEPEHGGGGDNPGTGDGMGGSTGGMDGSHTTGVATDGAHSSHRI